MVSKNNQWQHLRAAAQQVPHYGLRKLSVGVASVLLSTTLYMGVNAHADTVATPGETTTPAVVTGSNSASAVGKLNSETTGSSSNAVAGNSANGFLISQSSSANTSVVSEKPVASAANVKAGSEVPAQPGMSAISTNKQADTPGVNPASLFTPKLKLAVSQPATGSSDVSDVNVDLTNYWKQPADMSKATSAGGHTDWLDNGPNYVDAKVTDFKATMYADNATLSTKDWYRIGYQIGFDVDVANLQPGKILHLFRVNPNVRYRLFANAPPR